MTVRTTGGQVDEMTLALIEAANDDKADVRSQIQSSLIELGKMQPLLVLSSCHSYLARHAKLATAHRIIILSTIEKILKEKLDDVDKGLAGHLTSQASEELTHSKDVVPEWQTAASSVLVALCKKFCNNVMEELLKKFPPGNLPHYFVVMTLGNMAVANMFEMVPHINAVLGTMLPMLGMAKTDNMRWVFTATLSKFCQAIIDYLANIDKSPDPTVRKEVFQNEVYSAYDVLFNVWLQSKEAKLRLAIVECIGQMAHCLSRERLEEQLARLIPTVLKMYANKQHQPLFITQGLCMILDAAVEDESTCLEPYLDVVLNTLFPMVFNTPDFNNHHEMKNYSEVLRCFAVIAKVFSDRLVGYLMTKLESKDDRTRVAALSVIKHLVNSASEPMENKKALIISGMKMVMNDPSNKVLRAVCQLVPSLGHRGYLELEGGELLIEFVVRMCSLPSNKNEKRSADPEQLTNDQLRILAKSVLNITTTTIEDISTVLWPYLLELIVPERYMTGIGPVCTSLAYLAENISDSEDFEIDFQTEVNVPKPPEIISRLLVLSGRPLNGGSRGEAVLKTMVGIIPVVNETLVTLWEAVIPKLLSYLEENCDDETTWSQKTWEDLILKLLAKSLDEVGLDDWISELGEVLGQQITLYTNYPEEKNFAYKCLGIILRKSGKKDFVQKHLDLIFSTVRHDNQLEREGCAAALGFASTTHLDSVLTKLESVAKTDMVKKSGGLLGFVKSSKSDGDIERVKATVMLCYGYVSIYSPPDLMVSRMEAVILRSITPHFTNIKDTSVKQNLIRAVRLIGEALHPDHCKQNYSFSKRNDLIYHMQSFIKAEDPKQLLTETRHLAFDACTQLLKLEPKLTDADTFDLIKCTTDSVLALPPEGATPKKNETLEEEQERETLLEQTLEGVEALLKQALCKDPTSDGVDAIWKHLTAWLQSLQEVERTRALRLADHVFRSYTEFTNERPASGSGLSHLGDMLARMVPRCADPDVTVRQGAVMCIQTLLLQQHRADGNTEEDQMLSAIPTLRERLSKSDPSVLFSVMNDIAKVLAKKTPRSQLMALLEGLYDGLLDAQSHGSSGACVVLNGVIKARGSELRENVESILTSLHGQLARISAQQTHTGTLRAIRTLSTHHLMPSVQVLLNFPMPFDSQLVEIWKMIGQDGQLMQHVFEHFIDLLIRSLPYEERREQGFDSTTVTRMPTRLPLAVTCVLDELFRVEETKPQAKAFFHRLFSVLLIRLGSSVGLKVWKEKKKAIRAVRRSDDQRDQEKMPDKKSKKNAPPPPKESKLEAITVAISAFRGFLEQTDNEAIVEALEEDGAWDLWADEENFTQAATTLAKATVEHVPKQVAKIISGLTTALTGLYDNQRIIVSAYFAELVNQRCADDMSQVELLVNALLGRLVDSHHVVRMLCIRGLGNVSSLGADQVNKFTTTCLSAMTAGMEDRDDPDDLITQEAMTGLSKMLAQIEEEQIRPILVNVAVRIKPCFEKEQGSVRAAAVALFGNMSRFGSGPSADAYREQVRSNLIALLLHLNDPDTQVIRGCKYALKMVGPLSGSDDMNKMFQKHLGEEDNIHYGEFMNDLAKAIINDFSEHINSFLMDCVKFFKSEWKEIRGNAAMVVGFLITHLPAERYVDITKEHICAALIQLLKDPSADVRCRAAEAMSLMYDL